MKNTKLFLLAAACGLLLTFQAHGGISAVEGVEGIEGHTIDTSKMSASDLANQAQQILQQQFEELKKGLTDIKGKIEKCRYKTSSELDIINTPYVKLIFDLKNPGHGVGDTFNGFEVIFTIKLPFSIPKIGPLPGTDELIDILIRNPAKTIILKLIKGQEDSQTHVLRSSPTMEFIFRLALLAKDLNAKDSNGKPFISKEEFTTELAMLLTTLMQTKGIDNLSDVFNQIPGPFNTIISPVKSQIDKAWKELHDLVMYNFDDIKKLPLLGSADKEKIIRVMGAISFHFTIDYLKAIYDIQKTTEGKQALADLKARKITLKQFSEKYPQLNKVYATAQDRFLELAKHLKKYQEVKKQIMDKLCPIIDPILTFVFGITLTDLFPPDEIMAEASPEEMAAQQALESEDLEQIPTDEQVSEDQGTEETIEVSDEVVEVPVEQTEVVEISDGGSSEE